MSNNIVQNLPALKKLPKAWQVLSFEEAVKDCSGGNKKTLKSDFLDMGDYPIVDQGKNIVAGYTNNENLLVSSEPPYIVFGDHTRAIKYIDTKFAMGADGTKVLKPKLKDTDEKYLYYFLLTLNIPNTGYNRHFKYLKSAQIPLPPLPEQKKIAEILDAADSLRQKDQQLIEHYNHLSQSLFLDMFGDPVTNPKRWGRSKADSYIDLLTGFAFKSSNYSSDENDVRLCGGLIITPSGIDWDKANLWSREDVGDLEKYKVLEGDIVMAMDRPWISSGFKIHKITDKDHESLLVQRTARIRGRNINQDFLYFLYTHPAFEKQAKTTETTIPHISPNDIRNYELIIPPVDLQAQFATRIQAIETQKHQAQTNLKNSQDLFNSLLQKAFKGELTQ